MKKIFRFTSFLLLSIISASPLLAQTFSVGGEIGVISSINEDYEQTDIENRRNTYYSGLNLNYHYRPKITFSSGLHYLRQGYKHETCYIFAEGEKNELVGKLDYMVIPVSARFNIGTSNRLVLSLGIYGGMNIKAAQDYPEQIGGCETYYPKDLTNSTSQFMFGGSLGVGVKMYENEKIKVHSLLKYYQGLSNSMSNNHDYEIEWEDSYNSMVLSFTVDYTL